MRVPEHLQHKPIIGVDNYEGFDGMHSNITDAKALSIGKSQWDENEMAAKVWRHTTGDDTGKWSRQSEELPLHRVLDLSILIASIYSMDGETFPVTSLNEVIINPSEYNKLKEFLNKNKRHLQPRFSELKKLLEKMDI
ncbi:DUF6530 family protein [Bacillus benzoevorans]|uniref:Uncharacterized protein n=1 Tax=Bacillus benzoevorans TaxID=1456 RepID=A0A7X0LVR4_9BACI|nr:DUF6530 family protein [Bacillus benzoevorans]MBB6444554.1 hypothetical protein [Bacillus benzoevorans]